MPMVSSLEELIESAAGVLNGEATIEDIQFSEDFTCTITIEGPGREGFVTYDIAYFIIEVERNLKAIIRKTAQGAEFDLPKTRNIIRSVKVKAKVSDGSDKLKFFFDYFLGPAIKNMESHHILWAVIAYVSLMFGKSLLSTISDIKNKAKDEETKQRFIQFAEKALEQSAKYNQPMNTLVNKMGEQDTIKLPAKEKPLSKEEAKELFKAVEPIVEKTYYVDDVYELTDVSLDKLHVTLRKDRHQFIASTRLLAEESRQKLFTAVREAGIHEITAQMPLQVTLNMQGFQKSFFITALGDPRPEAVTLKSVVAKYADLVTEGAVRQGNLFDQ